MMYQEKSQLILLSLLYGNLTSKNTQTSKHIYICVTPFKWRSSKTSSIEKITSIKITYKRIYIRNKYKI